MKRKLLQIFVAILGFTLVGCDFLITTNSVQTTGTTFTVSFETNGGDLIEPVSVNSGSFYTMPTPVREGYVFESWYMDINMTAQYTAMTMLEEDITLYAGWTVGHYTLLFDDSGDDGLISIIQEFGVALETPDDPTKSGYTFGGWYSDSELTTPYVFTTMPAYDFTVYTKWISNQYSISFNTNGGNSISTITQDFGTIVTVSNPSKDSYIFDGWYLDSELTEPYTITTMPNENITVFAKWSHILYSISFNTNGGSDVTTITQEFGTVVVAPEEPTKFGYYSFNGWYLDSELSTLYTFTTMPNENIILYASWSESLTEDDPSNFSFTLKDDGTYEVSAYLGSNTEVVIPFFYLGKAVTSIGYTAFYGFSNITSIMIPMGVTYIDDYAFSGCSSLTNIAIPSSLTIIGAYAFYGCSSLTSITIPSGVISIGNEAFSYCSSLTSITVPTSVTNIGAFAFRGCGDLVSMILPFVGVSRNASGISALFGYLFGTTSYAGAVETKQYYSNSQFETFYIPSKLHTITITDASKIQFGAFYNCSNLTNIAVPMTVTSIGASAFFGCTSLTRFVIPTSVSSISNYVFSGCSNITTISIPAGVTSIGTSAFNGCIKLSSIFIPESVTSIGSSAFALCSNITSISIPSGVTIIGSSAFSGCSSLTSITIPMGVTIINASTFAGCVSLTSIAIPTVVTSIGASAFSGCISLSTITIPIGVIYIGSQAFMGCSGITSITIPVGVTSFGDSVFSGCINLASITVDKDNQYYLSENSVMFDKQKTILIAYPAKKSDASYQVPSTVTSILASAFYACENLVNISIPTGVTSIGSLAFYGCSSLESIVIPNGVTTISANTFYGCGSLESMTLPFVGESRTATSGSGLFGFIFGTTNYVGSVETNQYFSATQSTAYYIPSSLRTVIITDTRNLQYGAFYDCANLENIVIPNGVTSISSNTFHGCGSLKSISLPFVGGSRTITSGNAMLGYIFGTTTYEGSTATNQYYTPTLFTTYYIPTTLSTVIITGASMIQSGAFSGVSSLTSISVPFIGASRTATGNTALLGYIFGTINYTGSTPTTQYYSSTQFTTYYIPTNLASVVISDPTTIPYGAFYNCSSLLSISISSSAESISENAFYNCFNLDNISLPFIGASRTATEGSALFGYIFGTTYYLGSTATTQYFNSHSSITYFIPTLLRTVVITDGSEIPFGAFYNCSGVTSITLPSSVTKIGDSAFSDCSGITSITLPTGLTSLGSSAFFGCSGLSRVFIPQSVTTIGDNAFNGCINITIYVKVNSKPIGWSIDWNSTNRPVVWGAQA